MAQIARLLEDSVGRSLAGVQSAAVLLSGGLDSSLLALLASQHSKITCYVAGIPGSRDFSAASRAAGLLKLPLVKKELSVTHELLEKVAEAIGTSDRLAVEISVPLFVLLPEIRERTILSGQGADEIFLGYAKYYKLPPAEADAMAAADFRSLTGRDVRLAAGHGKELKMPYCDEALARAAQALPISERMADPILRKAVLRRAALELGLPAELASAPKKAVQYSSGVHKAAEKLRNK